MDDQLELAGTEERVWLLDRRTREIGRRGVAEAREALRRALPRTGAGAGEVGGDHPSRTEAA